MRFHFSDSLYRVIVFIALYVLSALMISGYWLMDNSSELRGTLRKVDNFSTSTGFKMYALVGLLQYGLLIVGVSIFLTLSFMIIKSVIQRK